MRIILNISDSHRKNGNKIIIIASLKHYVSLCVVEMGNNEDLKLIIEKPEYTFLSIPALSFDPEVDENISADKFLQIPTNK